jgi:hypothetical protein
MMVLVGVEVRGGLEGPIGGHASFPKGAGVLFKKREFGIV